MATKSHKSKTLLGAEAVHMLQKRQLSENFIDI